MELDAGLIALAVGFAAELRYRLGRLGRRVEDLALRVGAVERKPPPLPPLPLAGLLLAALLLSGCWGARSPVPGAPGPETGVSGGPGAVLVIVASWGAWIAAIGFLGCLIAAAVLRSWSLAKHAGTCLLLAASCQALHWTGTHLAALAGLGCAAGAGLFLWAHRRHLETLTGRDLNGDGQIGPGAPARIVDK